MCIRDRVYADRSEGYIADRSEGYMLIGVRGIFCCNIFGGYGISYTVFPLDAEKKQYVASRLTKYHIVQLRCI